MAVNSQVGLAAANLAFYIIAAFVTAYVILKLGFKRRGPWYFMALLCLIRIIGEPMLIATGGTLDLNNSVSIAGNALSSVGLSPVLLAAGGLIVAFNQEAGIVAKDGRQALLQRLWTLVPIAALVISIIGNTKLSSSNPDDRETAQTLRKAATALYIFTWAMVVVMEGFAVRARVDSERGPRILMYSVVPAIPLLLVRVIYQCLTTFGSLEDQLSNSNNIAEKAILSTLAEWLIVIIFLGTGAWVGHNAPYKSGQYSRGNLASPDQENGQGRASTQQLRYENTEYGRGQYRDGHAQV